MVSFPVFVTRPLACVAFAALLALGHSAAHAQAGPKPAPARHSIPQDIAYYVDGKPATPAEANKLKGDDIQSMDVVKEPSVTRQLGLTPEKKGVVLITTKANANSPEVLAFNQRFPLTPASPAQNAAVAAVQTYMQQRYPAAKVEAIFPVKDKADRYTAVYEENGQRLQLLFDGKGNPVAE